MALSIVPHLPDPAELDVERVKRWLAECRDFTAIKDFRDKATAVLHYMRVNKASRANSALVGCHVRRAEKRLGELCLTIPKNTGESGQFAGANSQLAPRPPRLKDYGISHMQSSRWQAIASVPEAEFESYLSDCVDRGEFPAAQKLVTKVRRERRVDDLAEIATGNVGLVTSGTYPIVYADPPWRYEHVKTENRAIENQYPTMALDEICGLSVAGLCTEDAVLFMWATSPKLAEAMRVLDAWGFVYRTNMVWVKDKIGMGYYARQRHELLLIATRGSPPTPAPKDRPDSVLSAARRRHSAKPLEFYEVIERMYPRLPKIELFCRRPREGWAAWGNQS